MVIQGLVQIRSDHENYGSDQVHMIRSYERSGWIRIMPVLAESGGKERQIRRPFHPDY
jgi:hypothetical protein